MFGENELSVVKLIAMILAQQHIGHPMRPVVPFFTLHVESVLHVCNHNR